jgi:cell migration-inducing and hyaluronan-binding protein
MILNRRSLQLLLLVPAVFSFSALAQEAVKSGNWSNSSTWSGGAVPRAGDAVTIAKDKNVVLDVTPPALRSLTIDGKLSFADTKDLELTTEWILLHGELEIGTEAKPHTKKAAITLTNNVKDENIMEMGDRGIMLMGDRQQRRHLHPGAGRQGLGSR